MSNWERTIQLVQKWRHSKLQEPPFSYAKLCQANFEKWHIPNNYFDSAFLGTKFSQVITYAKLKGSPKNETLWHLGNSYILILQKPHLSHNRPLKIHHGSTGWLCSPVALNESDSCYLHFIIKISDSPTSVQIWGLPSLGLRLVPTYFGTNLGSLHQNIYDFSDIFCYESCCG